VPKKSLPPISGRRIQTRRSGVHGKGVFALTDFAQGEPIIEYVGEIITWKEALRRHQHDPTDPNHTFTAAIRRGGSTTHANPIASRMSVMGVSLLPHAAIFWRVKS
jgi:SET domain-containing protein